MYRFTLHRHLQPTIHNPYTGSHKTHNPYTNPQTQDLIGLDFSQNTNPTYRFTQTNQTHTHHPRPKITTHHQNPIRNPNIGSPWITPFQTHHSKPGERKNKELKNREEKRREQPRGREKSREREREKSSQKPPLMVAVVSGGERRRRCMVSVREQ
jgi:hypothetical protein